jgi:putative ABC transport system permease protein
VTPGYFETLRIPLLSGRDFAAGDVLGTRFVVVLSRDTARRLFGNEDPLGRRIIMGSRGGGEAMEVIGVVGDVRSVTLAETAAVEFYRPITQRTLPFMHLAVRTKADPAAFAGTARQVLRSIDPELVLIKPTTLADLVGQSLAEQRLLARLLALFAALALTLSVVGIYSVVAYTVRQGSADIGLRMALGARPRDVLGLTIGQGMVPVMLGLAFGLAACTALGRLIKSQLYGVSPLDGPTLAGAVLSLATVAIMACWVPARRATRIDPVRVLRVE